MHRSSIPRWGLVVGLVAAGAGAPWPVRAAQEAAPTPTPCLSAREREGLAADAVPGLCRSLAGELTPPAGDVPGPEECTVAPRPVAAVAQRLTPPASAPSPVPATTPPAGAGAPVDGATAAGVAATVRRYFACSNAGDLLRASALLSDAFVRSLFGGMAAEQRRDALELLATPIAVGEQVFVLYAVRDVRVLADGRVTAAADVYHPFLFRDATFAFVLVRAGAGWLIDAQTIEAPAPATPPA